MLLADAYTETDDEKYARTVVEHMLDYIERVPPFDPTVNRTWSTRDRRGAPLRRPVGRRRTGRWPSRASFLAGNDTGGRGRYPPLRSRTRPFFAKHHWKTGNHATLEVASLGIIGTFFSDFADAPTWRAYAVEFLMGMWDTLFHDDGYSKEMSGAYHWVAMRSFFAFYEVAGNKRSRRPLSPGVRRLAP